MAQAGKMKADLLGGGTASLSSRLSNLDLVTESFMLMAGIVKASVLAWWRGEVESQEVRGRGQEWQRQRLWLLSRA